MFANPGIGKKLYVLDTVMYLIIIVSFNRADWW